MSGTVVIQTLKADSLTWDQALSMFRLRSRAGGHSPRTAEHYTWTLTQAAGAFRRAGAERPSAVSPVHVKQYLDDCRGRGLASSTLQTRYQHLKTFFRSLISDGLQESDPTGKVSRPRSESKTPKAFRPEDFSAVLAQLNQRTATGKRDTALFCLLFDSGARISEVLGLRISEMDLGQNIVSIRGKGGKHRLITWGERTRRTLVEWLRCRPDAKPTDPLFCSIYGDVLTRHAVRQRLKRLT